MTSEDFEDYGILTASQLNAELDLEERQGCSQSTLGSPKPTLSPEFPSPSRRVPPFTSSTLAAKSLAAKETSNVVEVDITLTSSEDHWFIVAVGNCPGVYRGK